MKKIGYMSVGLILAALVLSSFALAAGKPNPEKCSSNAECMSGFCSNTICCDHGFCGWGDNEYYGSDGYHEVQQCVGNGGEKQNQWVKAICRGEQWNVVAGGWGCGIFPCDQGTCVNNVCVQPKAYTEKCASDSECSSGFCSNAICCFRGLCGWGDNDYYGPDGYHEPQQCVGNGEVRANQWASGVCRSGQWKVPSGGWGCGVFPCDEGACVNNICVAKKIDLEQCSSAAECESNICLDGLCGLKPNGWGCSENGQCRSANCSYGAVCCNSNECGWGAPVECVADGDARENQWLSGVCRGGTWKTVFGGLGCGFVQTGRNFPCDQGVCVDNICVVNGSIGILNNASFVSQTVADAGCCSFYDSRDDTLSGFRLGNWAEFGYIRFPRLLKTGEKAQVMVDYMNRGTTTWSSAGYGLGSQNPPDNLNWGLNRIGFLDTPVLPGKSIRFVFDIQAPARAGTYNLQWRMVQEGVEWFGEPTYNAVIDVIDKCFNEGDSYHASIIMKNTGNETWDGISYEIGSQTPQDNKLWGISRIPAPFAIKNSEGTWDFSVQAPLFSADSWDNYRIYNFQWRMIYKQTYGGMNEEWFGEYTDNLHIASQVNCVNEAAAEPLEDQSTTTLIQGTTTTTSSTLSGAATTTSTTLIGPEDVILKYRATDDHAIASCTVWTNLSNGNWAPYQTFYDVVNGAVNTLVLESVPPGRYMWNVTCVDDKNQESSLSGASNTPNGYWVFLI